MSSTAPSWSIGVDVPAGRMTSSLFNLHWVDQAWTVGDANWYDTGGYNFTMISMSKNGGTFGGTGNPLLKPEELWNIDTKLDDGKPASGIIIATKSSGSWMTGCTTTDNPDTAAYNLSNSAISCYVLMAIK
jgi:hypothetical protein